MDPFNPFTKALNRRFGGTSAPSGISKIVGGTKSKESIKKVSPLRLSMPSAKAGSSSQTDSYGKAMKSAMQGTKVFGMPESKTLVAKK